MKKLISALILSAGLIHAETVYVTPHGKTFHKNEKCQSLERSHNVLPVDRTKAEAHGLKPCSLCYREHKKQEPDWRKQ